MKGTVPFVQICRNKLPLIIPPMLCLLVLSYFQNQLMVLFVLQVMHPNQLVIELLLHLQLLELLIKFFFHQLLLLSIY
ncbi:MAG: hypothetical protein CMG85_18920 [Marinobacter sp.]|nr:hypothetical protein [Marinobacter sp.]